MSFKEAIVGGVALIRSAIQSPGYLVGVFGWTINADGSAEFNNVTVRGGIVIGPANGNHISSVILNVGPSGSAAFAFYSGDAAETAPGAIGAVSDGTANPNSFALDVQSGERGNGHLIFGLYPPPAPASGLVGTFDFRSSGTAPPTGGFLTYAVQHDTTGQWRSNNVQSAPSGNQAINVGPLSGTALRISNAEIQAVVAGPAIAQLSINPAGGNIVCPAMRSGQSTDLANHATSSTAYVTAGNLAECQILYPTTGIITVHVSARCDGTNGTLATDTALLSFEVRDGAGGTGSVLLAASDNNCAVQHALATGGTQPTIGRTVTVAISAPAGGIGSQIYVRPMIRVSNGTTTANTRLWSVTANPEF